MQHVGEGEGWDTRGECTGSMQMGMQRGKSTWAHADAGELRAEMWGSHILGSSTEGLGFKYRGLLENEN